MKRLSYAMLPFAALALPLMAAAKPTVGTVYPVTATANVAVTLSASVNSGVPIQSCNLYVDLEDVGAMTVANGVASKSYTFPYGGSRIAFVFCRDTSAGLAAGQQTGIWVEGTLQNQPPLSSSAPTPAPAPTLAPAPTPAVPVVTSGARRLVKLSCPADAAADHACKAVYYIGIDGKRHAFPNSRVFFTWYANFDTVTEVTPQELSAIPLGKNVTYRPGARMVKFTTLNKVYAVTRDGELRWVKTEPVAVALYGADWNTKIDDVSDVFYLNYAFGPDIDSAASFSPELELASRSTFD